MESMQSRISRSEKAGRGRELQNCWGVGRGVESLSGGGIGRGKEKFTSIDIVLLSMYICQLSAEVIAESSKMYSGLTAQVRKGKIIFPTLPGAHYSIISSAQPTVHHATLYSRLFGHSYPSNSAISQMWPPRSDPFFLLPRHLPRHKSTELNLEYIY